MNDGFEAKFWTSMRVAVQSIKAKQKSNEVQ